MHSSIKGIFSPIKKTLSEKTTAFNPSKGNESFQSPKQSRIKFNQLNINVQGNVLTLVPTKSLIHYYFLNIKNIELCNVALIELFSNHRIKKEDVNAQEQFLWHYKQNPFLLEESVKERIFPLIRASILSTFSTYKHKIGGLLFILKMYQENLTEDIFCFFTTDELPFFVCRNKITVNPISSIISQLKQKRFSLDNPSSQKSFYKINSAIVEIKGIVTQFEKKAELERKKLEIQRKALEQKGLNEDQIAEQMSSGHTCMLSKSESKYYELIEQINKEAQYLLPHQIEALFSNISVDKILTRSFLNLEFLTNAAPNVPQELINALLPIVFEYCKNTNIDIRVKHKCYDFLAAMAKRTQNNHLELIYVLLIRIFENDKFYVCEQNFIFKFLYLLTEKDIDAILTSCLKELSNPNNEIANESMRRLATIAPRLTIQQVQQSYITAAKFIESNNNYLEIRDSIDYLFIVFSHLSEQHQVKIFNCMMRHWFDSSNHQIRNYMQKKLFSSNMLNFINDEQLKQLSSKIHQLVTTKSSNVINEAVEWCENWLYNAPFKLNSSSSFLLLPNVNSEEKLLQISLLWNRIQLLEDSLQQNNNNHLMSYP